MKCTCVNLKRSRRGKSSRSSIDWRLEERDGRDLRSALEAEDEAHAIVERAAHLAPQEVELVGSGWRWLLMRIALRRRLLGVFLGLHCCR